MSSTTISLSRIAESTLRLRCKLDDAADFDLMTEADIGDKIGHLCLTMLAVSNEPNSSPYTYATLRRTFMSYFSDEEH